MEQKTNETVSTRNQALIWWNDKSNLLNRTTLFNKYFSNTATKDKMFTVANNYEELTGREIEEIWQKEVKRENIYLNRLKEQYKFAVQNEESEFYISRLENYQSVRAFCLDTQLVSFSDIEQMEYEVNSSFS